MRVKKLREDAIIPTKAYKGDVGWDLYSLNDRLLHANELSVFDLGIAMEIPEGYFGMIADRSSMGKKEFKVFGGIIDSPYRGEISLCLKNTGSLPQYIKKGDKIAQLLIIPYADAIYEMVEVEELSVSERNTQGFGSSGQ